MNFTFNIDTLREFGINTLGVEEEQAASARLALEQLQGKIYDKDGNCIVPVVDDIQMYDISPDEVFITFQNHFWKVDMGDSVELYPSVLEMMLYSDVEIDEDIVEELICGRKKWKNISRVDI